MKPEISDETFGLLRQWPHNPNSYAGQVNLRFDALIEIFICLECSPETESVENIMSHARLIFAALQTHEGAIRRVVANEHLPLYNECWLQSPDDVLTMDEFLGEMTIESVELCPGGESKISYTVGERFTDHTLITYFNDQCEVTHIDFAG